MENEGKKGPEFRIALSRKKASSLCVLCVCLCSLCVHVIFFVPRKDEKKKSEHSALIPPGFLGGGPSAEKGTVAESGAKPH